MSEFNPLHEPKPSGSQVDQKRSWKPVLESHLDLLREKIFSDVTFIVGPSKERIPCHQLFLKARSPVFQVMFSEHWNHGKEIPLEDVDSKIFTKFLEFIYADTFEANVYEALGLLQVAHKYDVQLLVDKCEQLLGKKGTLNDAVDIFQAARKYDKIKLMEKCGHLMSKSLSELQTLPSFSRLDKQTLTFILKRNDLKMKEADLFRLALRWAKNQSGLTAHESLEDILPHIRFPLMTLEEFTKTVVPTGLLSQSKVIELFTYFGSDSGTKKSLAGTLEFSTQRRKPTDSMAFVSIYDYENGIGHEVQECKKLRECLQFYINSPCKSNYLEKLIGLSSITVYCPARQSPPGEGCFTKFKIQLMSTDCFDGNDDIYKDQNHRELLLMSPVKMEEGKATEINFETVIPVRQKKLYRIIVEETTLYGQNIVPGFRGLKLVDSVPRFYTKDFGRIADNVDVIIGQKCQAVLTIRRNKLKGFGLFECAHPVMICKLGFEEF